MPRVSYEIPQLSKRRTVTAAAFDMVRDVVMAHRNSGMKANYAVDDAAAALGVSPRWIVSVLRNEPHAVKPSRFAKMLAGYRQWLETDIARSEAILEQRRQKLAEMRGGHVAAALAHAGATDEAGLGLVDGGVK